MSTLKVGSVELYYEEHGKGYPLLLIMGLATDSRGWMMQVPEFAEHYRTIVFDNRGVGRSSKPPGPYSIHEMAEDTAALLAALGIERTHVLGISMGGMIAQELVLRRPDLVNGLALACTYPEPDEDVEKQLHFSIGQFGGSITTSGEMEIDVKAIDPIHLFEHLLPAVFNQDYLERELPRLIELFAGGVQYGFSMEAILGQIQAAIGHRAIDRLHEIRSPTLVITGDSDRLIPPANSDVLAGRIPNARLVKIPGGSHGFNFETPELFNREILDFLSELPT